MSRQTRAAAKRPYQYQDQCPPTPGGNPLNHSWLAEQHEPARAASGRLDGEYDAWNYVDRNIDMSKPPPTPMASDQSATKGDKNDDKEQGSGSILARRMAADTVIKRRPGPKLSESEDEEEDVVPSLAPSTSKSFSKAVEGSSSPTSSVRSDSTAGSRKRTMSSSPGDSGEKQRMNAANRQSRSRTRVIKNTFTKGIIDDDSSSDDSLDSPTIIRPRSNRRRDTTDSKRSKLDSGPYDASIHGRPITPTPSFDNAGHSSSVASDFFDNDGMEFPNNYRPRTPSMALKPLSPVYHPASPSMPQPPSPGCPLTPSMPARPPSPDLPATPAMPVRPASPIFCPATPSAAPRPHSPPNFCPATPSAGRPASPPSYCPATPSIPAEVSAPLSPPLTPSPRLRSVSPAPPPTPSMYPRNRKTPSGPPATKAKRERESQSSKQLVLYNKEREIYNFGKHRGKGEDGDLPEPAPGIIKSITMTNIMSHRNFSKEWNQTMNFITGENGSGKSAILSGIVAGLGGKALDTGRASSMKEMITNGQKQAKIKIVLHNPYSAQYGEDITIVRHLSSEGNSRYQIKDANGCLRSLGRQELNLVLSKLNIQVNNPLAVLHQEMSRNFLRTNDPAVLYKYFHRALLLSSCETLLKKASTDMEAADLCLKQKSFLLEELRSREEEFRTQLERINAMKNLEKEIDSLKRQHVWAVVKQYEDEVVGLKEKEEKARKELQKWSNATEAAEAKVNETKANLEEYSRRYQSTKEEIDSLNSEFTKKRSQFYVCQNHINQLNAEIESIDRFIASNEKTCQIIAARANEQRESIEKTWENNKREAQEKVSEIDEQLTRIRAEKEELHSRLEKLREDVTIAEQAKKESGYELEGFKKRIVKCADDIKKAECSKKSKYDAYGPEMNELMKKIAVQVAARRFTERPRGPLGSCFTVKEEKWAGLVEYILGNSVYSFCVDTKEDKELITQLIDEVYGGIRNYPVKKPSICLMRFGKKRLDVRHGKAFCDFPTVVDVLDITDNDYVVYNWLIDTQRIERILLFDNYSVGCDFMKNGHGIPPTTARGYTLDAYMIYPDPNFRAYAQSAIKQPRFLKVTLQESSNSMVENMKAEKYRYERELAEKKRQHEPLQQHLDTAQAILNDVNSNIKRLLMQESTLDSRKRTYDQLLYQTPPDVTSFMDEYESCKAQIDQKQEERRKHEEGLAVHAETLRNVALDAVEQRIKDLTVQKTEMLKFKGNLEGQVRDKERESKQWEVKKNCAIKAHADAYKKFQAADAEANRKVREAESKCARVLEFDGSAEQIKIRHDAILSEYRRNKKKVEEKQQMEEDYRHAKDMALRVASEIEVMGTLIKLIKPKIKIQSTHFKKMTNDYGTAIRNTFRMLIRSRGYRGDFAISHEDQSLMCYVSLDKSSNNRALKSMEIRNGQQILTSKKGIQEFASSMSGGERSFTTICFLVACWQLMDMPFYILDEFDVFMDPLNRKISQKILMNVTRSKPHSQFFFFTPMELDCHAPSNYLLLHLQKNKNDEGEGREGNNRSKVRAIKYREST